MVDREPKREEEEKKLGRERVSKWRLIEIDKLS